MRKKNNELAKMDDARNWKTFLAEGLAEVSGSADIFEWNAEETKEFMVKQYKVDLKIQELLLIMNQ